MMTFLKIRGLENYQLLKISSKLTHFNQFSRGSKLGFDRFGNLEIFKI